MPFFPKSSKLSLTDESSTPFSESPSLSLSISKSSMEKILFCSPLFFIFFGFRQSNVCCFNSCCSQCSTLQLLFSPYYLLPLFPPLISFFLPPSSQSWKSISGHTIRAEGGGKEEFAGLGLHLDAQKGRSCCEELLFGMSAAPCSNVPVYHHCDYVRWLGWPLHHGRLKCGPRVPLDEILALNPSYEHCEPREGFFSLSRSLPIFFPASPILLKGLTRLTIHSVFYSFSLWFSPGFWCGTGNSKAPVSSCSTFY